MILLKTVLLLKVKNFPPKKKNKFSSLRLSGKKGRPNANEKPQMSAENMEKKSEFQQIVVKKALTIF